MCCGETWHNDVARHALPHSLRIWQRHCAFSNTRSRTCACRSSGSSLTGGSTISSVLSSDEERRRKERKHHTMLHNVAAALLAVVKGLAPYSESTYNMVRRATPRPSSPHTTHHASYTCDHTAWSCDATSLHDSHKTFVCRLVLCHVGHTLGENHPRHTVGAAACARG